LVKAAEDATYTFYTLVDDGVRLWVGNQLIIDKFQLTNTTNEYSGQVTLKKGKCYSLRMDYREGTGDARARLSWSTPSMPATIVPQTALYPVPVTIPAPPVGTISASADAYVQNGASSDTSFGMATTMQIKQATTDGLLRVGYLKFNLKNFTTISSAKLRLYGALSDNTSNNVETDVLGSPDTAWDESTITFNNAPRLGALISTRLITDNNAQYYEWDVTSYMQSEKAQGHNVVTLVVKNPAFANPFTFFNTREAGGNRPQLVIG
jgi:hypothetical protein